MNGDQQPGTESLPLSLKRRVDEVCDRFEKAWRAGQGPRIEAYLAEVPEPERVPLLRELLALEIEVRRKGGEKPTPEEYHRRFPEYIEPIDAAFAIAPGDATRDPPGSERATTPHTPPTESSTVDPDPQSPIGPAPVPNHIGRYKVIRRLGGGTYGDVYLAHDTVMDRQVAVKVPSAWLVATERAREEFLREARSVARLQHEGIVRAYDFGQESDKRCYIVYEFVEGESLAERIKPKRIEADPLSHDEAARIVAEVAEALHYAHLQEMFHRDIKPGNILLNRHGRPKVTDFGLAVHEQDLAGERGILAGTLHYMSTEQVRRECHHIDGRTDIYSLGVVLYELLCGRRPYEAKTTDELADQILHREAKPPRQIKDSIHPELERICLKALSKRINDRYTTAKDMGRELFQVAKGGCYPKRLEGQVEPAHGARSKKPKNLLHLMWNSLDSNLQDAFALAYNKKSREGSNRISTRDLFQALHRIGDYALGVLIESLPEGALPDPLGADVGADRNLLNADPLLSDCVQDSLSHFRKLAALPRKLAPVDIFVDIGQHGHGPSVARLRKHGVTPEALERQIEKHGLSVVRREPVTLQDVARRMASAEEPELRRLLLFLQEAGEPACVPLVFRCLNHSSEAVRRQAREIVHSLGWDKVSDTAEDLARRDDAAGVAAVLDGLAAFEAHPAVVALLDRLVVLLKGDLRNRTILLLERKRLGLELDTVGGLFRAIHSPYRIEKVLGQGLFAAAYLARAEGTDLAVVVRVLRPEFVNQPHLRAGFLDLNRRALQLVHENLVLTREARAFPERNTYFAVRDYINGVTLQKLVEAGKHFEPAQIMRILRQLLAALGPVHRGGMTHGGIKPSNVFVCENDRVVLGDLALPIHGIGVTLERLSYDYRYAAPESLRGATVGPQSDFYSLGCVAYELACGEPPFVSDNYLDLAARHMRDAVVPPSQRGSRLGTAGDKLLLKLLAASDAERYVRAEDIVSALDELELLKPPSKFLGRAGGQVGPHTAPLIRDTSLARFQGTESVLGFDASVASLMQATDDTLSPHPAPPPQAAVQRSRIGNYEVLELLGRGGMGVVYKGFDPRLQRVVALKMLPSSALGLARRLIDPTAAPSDELTRFRLEALAVAKLHDPHIVQIYELGEHDGQPYIALEYVGGGSLAQKLRTERPTPRAAAEMVAKLAGAVHHAHVHGVLHRDLKPSNVLLTPDGQPKIADFGLAKIQELPKEDAVLTHSGMIIGTPSYMAPEQAAGEINMISSATDIFSLGAILYESLTGRPPFQGESVMATLSQIATGSVIPAHTHNPAVSLDLSAICMKCLQKEPQNRYGSAQALAEDLERWLKDSMYAQSDWRTSISIHPVQASRHTGLARLTRWCLRVVADLFLFRKRG
jgi:serine/threonine protein kinase